MPAFPHEQVDGLIATGASARMAVEVSPRFVPGDVVIARNINPTSHTRLPRYIRGKAGVVEIDRGVFCFNDTNAHGEGHKPQHLYGVRFTARDLWGEQAPAKDSLHIDMFEDYIEPHAG